LPDHPKQGFDMPIDAWLRGTLREMFEDLVLARVAPVSALIDRAYVRTLFRSHLSGRATNGSILWALLVLARWSERYLENAPSKLHCA
jgi:asparagine synthase (glutamine-hydrolysing)